jgi:hypothetical protein
LSVIYGQEIRVYALLPVVYLGMLLKAERYWQTRSKTALVALALLEWIALHLHYISVFAVAAHALVALASLPWFAAVFFNRAAVQSEANAGTFATEPVPLDYLFPQVWAFHLTGLANALARPAIVWIAGTGCQPAAPV